MHASIIKTNVWIHAVFKDNYEGTHFVELSYRETTVSVLIKLCKGLTEITGTLQDEILEYKTKYLTL